MEIPIEELVLRIQSSSLEFRKFLLQLIREANNDFIAIRENPKTGELITEDWENTTIQQLLVAIALTIVEETEDPNGMIDPNQDGLSWNQLITIIRLSTGRE